MRREIIVILKRCFIRDYVCYAHALIALHDYRVRGVLVNVADDVARLINDVKTVFVGFGNVGRHLVIEVARSSLPVRVCGVLSSRGGVIVVDDDSLHALIRLAERGLKLNLHRDFREGLSLDELLDVVEPELAFVTIPPSYDTGEPNISIYRKLIERGVSIITSDKTGLAMDYQGLVGGALRKGLFLGYRATVAAGTPAIDFVRGLRGRRVEVLRGVLNSTTNYILTLVEKGMGYEQAIRKAVEEKVAEPDPRIDVEGLDAAAKISILSSELGYTTSIRDVERTPLTSIGEEDVRGSVKRGLRVRYVAETRPAGKPRVYPAILGEDDPLYRVVGMRNAVSAVVEGEKITVEGPAGPAWRTAKTMITDLIDYLYSTRYPGAGTLHFYSRDE